MKASLAPKISVVMAVYNGMPYLKEAVKSILGQTYKNFEFIIIDDASVDGTSKYLSSIDDKRVRIISNKKNVGLSKSLNLGLAKSNGELIARMDADDISTPDRFEKQVNFLKIHPDIDLCGTWVDLIDEKGQKIGEKKYPTDPKEVKNAIVWHTAVVHPTFMGKNQFFKSLHGYREAFDMAEDYDLLQRARNQFKITNIPKKLLRWRMQDLRRSRKSMRKMDKIDLKIKIDALKRDGISAYGILALTKKFILIYSLPYPIKYKLATILKRA